MWVFVFFVFDAEEKKKKKKKLCFRESFENFSPKSKTTIRKQRKQKWSSMD